MSSDEGEEILSSPLFKHNEEWKDVTPIYHSADETAAVKIAYSEQFIDAFAYLRALLQTKEISARAVLLTESCINLNPANYTAWQYRRDLLKELGVDLLKELDYLDSIINESPKNYQVWHHRRTIVGWIGASAVARELAFTDIILSEENKNYHAWMHRHWVVRTWPDEIDVNLEMSFSLKLLAEDSRNNSAWNYRYYILSMRGLLLDPATIEVEINLCKRFIEKMPNNESVWNYLGGLLMENGYNSNADVVEFAENLYQNKNRSPYLIQFLCDIIMERLDKSTGDAAQTDFSRVHAMYKELEETDPVRINYWKYKGKLAENLLQKAKC